MPSYENRPWLDKVRLNSTPPTFREPKEEERSRAPLWMKLAAIGVIAAGAGIGWYALRAPGPIDSLDYALPAPTEVAPSPRVGGLRIDVNGSSINAGTGSVVNYKTVTLIVTAHHIFGPPGGLLATMDAKSVSRKVSLARLDAQDGEVDSRRALLLDGAAPMKADDGKDDVAAFLVDPGERAPTLATELPESGAALTLVLAQGRRTTVRVIDAKPNRIFYETDGDVGKAASGAPLYNVQGELSGIHLGTMMFEGKLRSVANPAPAIRAKLEKAIL